MQKFSPLLLFLCLCLCLWAVLGLIPSPSVYWRDSGEFVLSAFYLDIAHPAGFPTYSSLANVFALLPFGPIAWRVNLFSAWTGALNATACVWLSWRILTTYFSVGHKVALLYSLSAVPVLFGSTAFLHQSGTAEVYMLNSLFFAVLVSLYVEFRISLRRGSGDLRYLIGAAFVSGLGLGNHVSLGAVVLTAFVLLLVDIKHLRSALLPMLFLGALGLSIYVYLPLRAEANVPLRTGSPATFERVFNFVTDARDRHLKTERGGPVAREGTPFSGLVGPLQGEYAKLTQEISPAILLLGLLGLLRLGSKDLTLAIFPFASAFGIWLFFYGWQPLPWLPVFMVFSVGIAVAIAAVIPTSLKAIKGVEVSAAVFGILLCIFSVPSRSQIGFVRNLRSYDEPARFAKATLSTLPPQSVFVTESSWFLVAYARYIERFRSDVIPVYQPRLLFPQYFEPIALSVKSSPVASAEATEADLNALGSFVRGVAAAEQWFTYEPNITINSYLKDVTNATQAGIQLMSPKHPVTFNIGYPEWRLQYLAPFFNSIRTTPSLLSDDARSHLETLLVNEADLLVHQEKSVGALWLYEHSCKAISPIPCSPGALNNIRMLSDRK